MGAKAFLIAAPASSSGKTTIVLALLRLLSRKGIPVASAKIGPDYIDPAFHARAGSRLVRTLDSWAMRPETLSCIAAELAGAADLVIGEGAMGLFDGAADGRGSSAELARLASWPVVLVVDAKGQGASAAALVKGFMSFDPAIRVAGVIFNRVGSPSHAGILERAVRPLGLPVLGCLPRTDELVLPERHLGLVQAVEHPGLDAFLDRAADLASSHLDIEALAGLASPVAPFSEAGDGAGGIAPLGQRIAVAEDAAFAFAYPFLLAAWRRRGAEILPFSPLADEAPAEDADAVFLPGGYPELHAGRLAANRAFLDGVRAAAARGAFVYGECGGYMVLGQGLVDASGRRHAMAGLLGLETSFQARRLHLGYRHARLVAAGPLGGEGSAFRGHEFHYASVLAGDGEAGLFAVADAAGRDHGLVGARSGSVAGSFIHLIDRA